MIEEFAGVENVEVIVRDEGMSPWLSAFLLFTNSWVVWAAEKNMVPSNPSSVLCRLLTGFSECFPVCSTGNERTCQVS